jgi:hypothetical protein
MTNNRIKQLANKAGYNDQIYEITKEGLNKFAKLIVEDVLDEVKERAYYTGDRDWSDEVDRPWIQLEFGYGSLADAQKGIFK